MPSPLEDSLNHIYGQVVAYFPSLLAGIVLIGIGWFLGWLTKRIVAQMLSVLRLDRVLRRFKWGAAFIKADVRYAIYEWIGNAVFLVVFLVLFNAALDALKLTTLSSILSQAVLFVPKLTIAILLLGLGWAVAGWIGGVIQRALTKEGIPRATMIARFTKTILMLFFSAMALTEIDIAREIVIIGFSVAMITLGGMALVLTSLGAKSFVAHIMEKQED